jgi:hypothetical protein
MDQENDRSASRSGQKIFGRMDWEKASLIAVVLYYCAMMTGRTLSRGTDFMVFYDVASRFWDGIRPYDIEAYGNLVFKYPPWILPAFLPFGFFEAKVAKFLWGVVQSISLIFVVHRFSKEDRVPDGLQAFTLLLFFGVFGLQGMLGQISLPLLALALACRPLSERLKPGVLLAWGLSAKIFSVFPLIFVLWKRRDRWRWLFASIAAFVALSLPMCLVSYASDPVRMVKEWVIACFSGVENKSRGLVEFTNREAQGLPSLFFRQFEWDQENRWLVITLVIGCFITVALLWAVLSKRLDERTQWYGWLALMPVVQPLGWIHFFVFAYPLAISILSREWSARRRLPFATAALAVVLIAAVTEKSFGKGFGGFLESWSVKSIGVLLLAWVSVRIPRPASTPRSKE